MFWFLKVISLYEPVQNLCNIFQCVEERPTKRAIQSVKIMLIANWKKKQFPDKVRFCISLNKNKWKHS